MKQYAKIHTASYAERIDPEKHVSHFSNTLQAKNRFDWIAYIEIGS